LTVFLGHNTLVEQQISQRCIISESVGPRLLLSIPSACHSNSTQDFLPK